MPPKTKGDTNKFLLGQPDSVLHQAYLQAIQEGKGDGDILPWSGPLQLPTVEQVLKLYFYLREAAGRKNSFVTRAEVVLKVAEKVVKYWSMAGFMTMKMCNVISKIKKEVEKYENLQKKKSSTSEKEITKREEYLSEIRKLFDIATPNLEDILAKSRILNTDDQCTRYRQEAGYTRKTEDLTFLLDQRSERKMVMGGRDTSFEDRVVSNSVRKNKYVEGVEGSSKSSMESGSMQPEWDEEDKDANNNDEIDLEYKDHSRKKKEDTVLIELPKDIFNNPEVCSMLDRTATTSRKAVGVVSTIIKSGKIQGKEADLSQFILSRKTLERKRASNRSVMMQQVMVEFQEKKPKFAALHWDGKLMKDITGTLKEQESIIVSGAPHYIEGKLLSVSKLEDEEGNPTSTGEAQAAAVLDQVDAWGLRYNVKAFVFDTTASNTGVKQGATVRVLKELGRPVFFLACRHHVCELIAKACWYSIFEADLSPECKFFSDIKEDWKNFDTSSEAIIVTLDKDLVGRDEALDFYRGYLTKKTAMPRDDYKEIAECAMLLLGEIPPSGKIVWRKPGACHKARFMAFGIYSLKALAFSKQLELEDDTVEGLQQFCSFITTIYIPHFLSSSVGRDSAVNDLHMYKTLFSYRSKDPQLAEEALVVMRRHGWYTTPEVVMFSLFSSKLSIDEKAEITCKLLRQSQPQSYKLQKPKFTNIEEKTKLVDLVTPESYKFFDILGLDCSWLEKNPDKWEEDESYLVAKEFVTTVKVVNDTAERGVKMAEDYATILTKDDDMRAMIMQGVEQNRAKYSDFKKATLNN